MLFLICQVYLKEILFHRHQCHAALIASSLKVIIFNAAFSASDASVKSTFPSKLVSPDRLEELSDIFKVVFSIRGFSPILFPA